MAHKEEPQPPIKHKDLDTLDNKGNSPDAVSPPPPPTSEQRQNKRGMDLLG